MNGAARRHLIRCAAQINVCPECGCFAYHCPASGCNGIVEDGWCECEASWSPAYFFRVRRGRGGRR
jgi:hypothetical protein